MVFGCFLEHDCDIGQVDIMILYKGYEMNGLHIDGLDGGDRMFISLIFFGGDRWLRAGSRKIQVARKCVVWAKSGGNLPSLKLTATLQLEMDAWNTIVSFWGPLHVFRGVLVSFSECKSFKSKLLGARGVFLLVVGVETFDTLP